jgi:hypothetical protein
MTETPETAPAEPVGEQTAMSAFRLHADIQAAIDAWFVEHIRNSPLAQATHAYNHLVDKIGALKAGIVAAVKKEN